MAMTLNDASKAYQEIMTYRKTTRDEAIGFLNRFVKAIGEGTIVDEALVEKAELYCAKASETVPKDENGLPDGGNSNLKKIRKYLGGMMSWLKKEKIISREPIFPVGKILQNKGEAPEAVEKNVPREKPSKTGKTARAALAKPLKAPPKKLPETINGSARKGTTKAKSKSTQLAQSGSAEGMELTVEQEKLVSEAVMEVNRLFDKTSDSILEIGRYLLRTFFENAPGKVRNRSKNKSVTLRALAAHDNMVMSSSALHDSVSLAIFEEELAPVQTSGQVKELGPVQTSGQVTASHKILLYRVYRMNQALAKQYLNQVKEENWSVRQLKDALSEDAFIRARNAPALPGVSASVSSAIGPVDALFRFSITKVDDLSKQEAAVELKNAMRARWILNNLIRKLKTMK